MENVKPEKSKRNPRYLRSRITRKLIIETADEIFISEGYSKTTLEKIRASSRVSYGTIFSHYKGKDDLLSKIVDYYLYDFFMYQENPTFISDQEEVIRYYRELLLVLFRIVLERRRLFEVYRDAIGKSDYIADHWRSLINIFDDNTALAFSGFQKSGLIRDFDVARGVKSFSLLVNSYIWEISAGNEEDIETAAATIIDFLFHGFFKH